MSTEMKDLQLEITRENARKTLVDAQATLERAIREMETCSPRRSTMSQPTRTPEELVEALTDYLTGYGRDRPDDLKKLMAYEYWQQAAQRELERRATEVLTGLDSETLAAIAQGEIFMDRIARDALKRLEAKR